MALDCNWANQLPFLTLAPQKSLCAKAAAEPMNEVNIYITKLLAEMNL